VWEGGAACVEGRGGVCGREGQLCEGVKGKRRGFRGPTKIEREKRGGGMGEGKEHALLRA
jgi:hypothetical protein